MTLLEGADAAKRPILREKMQEALHAEGEITSEKIDAFIEKAQAIFKAEELPGERYYLKAMNCPHHHRIFAAEPHSYRDLPLRLAEYGTCYRYEQSGELFGLMRVRSLNMNDAHIYCTEEQFADEFRAVNDMYLKYFKLFGLEKYQMRFSTSAPEGLGKKYVNEPELWKKTEDMVRKVLIESGINYVEVANEAAFYGPKIDVQVWSAIGREFTIATNQVDFAVPAKFGVIWPSPETPGSRPVESWAEKRAAANGHGGVASFARPATTGLPSDPTARANGQSTFVPPRLNAAVEPPENAPRGVTRAIAKSAPELRYAT
jgi:hypothetical protein